MEPALTDDGFLDGRLKILQPRDGFRSGLDAVLLAASVPAEPGQCALDLGTGAGVAALCLGARVPGIVLTGLEVQTPYADLARRNAERNRIAFDVVEGDLAEMPKALGARSFDHVLMNPPYFPRGRWTPSDRAERARALGEESPLPVWIDAATRRLRPGGHLTLIQKAARLVDVIRAMDARLGGIGIKPVAAREGRAAELVIVRARKGARAAPQLFAPLVLHRGARHRQDGADMTEAAELILRAGQFVQF